MIAAERKPGDEKLYREEKYAAVYEINMLRCIFCGLCEEACPKQAIYLRHDKFVPVFTEREGGVFPVFLIDANLYINRKNQA